MTLIGQYSIDEIKEHVKNDNESFCQHDSKKLILLNCNNLVCLSCLHLFKKSIENDFICPYCENFHERLEILQRLSENDRLEFIQREINMLTNRIDHEINFYFNNRDEQSSVINANVEFIEEEIELKTESAIIELDNIESDYNNQIDLYTSSLLINLENNFSKFNYIMEEYERIKIEIINMRMNLDKTENGLFSLKILYQQLNSIEDKLKNFLYSDKNVLFKPLDFLRIPDDYIGCLRVQNANDGNQ